MQISWQAQRFVKLEVQILCGNLGRASKPKSHPNHLRNLYQKWENLQIKGFFLFPLQKLF